MSKLVISLNATCDFNNTYFKKKLAIPSVTNPINQDATKNMIHIQIGIVIKKEKKYFRWKLMFPTMIDQSRLKQIRMGMNFVLSISLLLKLTLLFRRQSWPHLVPFDVIVRKQASLIDNLSSSSKSHKSIKRAGAPPGSVALIDLSCRMPFPTRRIKRRDGTTSSPSSRVRA